MLAHLVAVAMQRKAAFTSPNDQIGMIANTQQVGHTLGFAIGIQDEDSLALTQVISFLIINKATLLTASTEIQEMMLEGYGGHSVI